MINDVALVVLFIYFFGMIFMNQFTSTNKLLNDISFMILEFKRHSNSQLPELRIRLRKCFAKIPFVRQMIYSCCHDKRIPKDVIL